MHGYTGLYPCLLRSASSFFEYSAIRRRHIDQSLTWYLLYVSQILDTVVQEGTEEGAGPPASDRQQLLYCERFVELLIDLLSQLPTRRFVRTLLEDKAILVKARMSPLFAHPQGEGFFPALAIVNLHLLGCIVHIMPFHHCWAWTIRLTCYSLLGMLLVPL